ncbi:PREDICTED: uncharacterized protein LOC104752783 [Camelina sativa]|uniref:Uncharacterized protein LOC104752783 n=1 Tax=Camelina sativa TaxID=90675 RepID=A0ABM1R3L8_CAMSA|nr:PREDICTED: uncharacterized protein LOC104752783 [Camelina sativa]XP_019093607.1 PREDICTED: uncharacterized protein LOC104752783 [Camelina sativa]
MSQLGFNGSASSKLGYQSPKIGVYSKGVSVLMPGDHIPTFTGYPVPAPVLCVSNSRSSSPNSTIEEC